MGSRHQVKLEILQIECNKWLLLLSHLVNFCEGLEEVLKLFFQNQQCQVLKKESHRVAVMDHVSVYLLLLLLVVYMLLYLQMCSISKPLLSKMNVQQFGCLFKTLNTYPSEFVEIFLKDYDTHSLIQISNPVWISLFNEVVSRFPGAKSHSFFLEFLSKVEASYIKRGRNREFMIDILTMKVPKLFAVNSATQIDDLEVVEKFRVQLRQHINNNALKLSIVSNLSRILVSWCMILRQVVCQITGGLYM